MNRSDSVTDLSGIGPATADDLATQGIRTVGDLVDEYQRIGSRNLPNARVASAARDASLELSDGGFDDPDTGLTITPENRGAAELLGFRSIGDFDSIDTNAAKSSVQEVRDADTPLGALVEPAREGRLGNAPGSVLGWAADAAENLTDDELGSGGIQDLNRVKGFDDAETTRPGKAYGNDSGLREAADQSFSLNPLGTARAMGDHQDRSAKAQRVDEMRDAPRTDDYETWSSDPSHYDYPGVDTKQDFDTFFADERKSRRGGLGSRRSENRDKDKLRRNLETIANAPAEVKERATGEPFEFDLRGF